MITQGLYSSIDNTWNTPLDYFLTVNAEFRFELDAAALCNSALCELWFGPDHPNPARRNAFGHSWHTEASSIWLNPPYGREIKNWMRKADEEAQAGATVVCLVPARTDTNWWHDSCIQHEVRFIKGRLKFNKTGQAPAPAPFPSALVVMRGK